MFKKKKQTDLGRHRQPATQESNRSTVFSYHANRSARTDAATGRTAPKSLFLSNDTADKKPKKAAPAWRKRVPFFIVCVGLVLLAVNSLLLSNNPRVVPLVASHNRELFLRDKQVYEQATVRILHSSLANTNKVTIDTADISRKLKTQFPELENVTVVLPLFGRRPVVYIQPSVPMLLFKSSNAGGLYVLDRSGRTLMNAADVADIEGFGLPVVEDQSGLSVGLGKVAVPSGNVSFITEVVGQLQAKQLKVVSLVLPQGTSELDVRLDGVPYLIKFNLMGDARGEAGAYLAVKQYLEQNHKVPASYVDVRVDNRAYYK